MSHPFQHFVPGNTYKVVDNENRFWGILGNADISKCTLYHHNIAAICKSSSSKDIVLYKDMRGVFDFTIRGTVCHDQSFEACIDELACIRLGEKPLDIKFSGISRPHDTQSNFISYYEIYYSEKFIRNVICGGNLTILDIEEFQNLCTFFPKDIDPLLRESAHSIYELFPAQIN